MGAMPEAMLYDHLSVAPLLLLLLVGACACACCSRVSVSGLFAYLASFFWRLGVKPLWLTDVCAVTGTARWDDAPQFACEVCQMYTAAYIAALGE